MELKKRAVSLAACAVMLMSAGAPMMNEAGVFEQPVRVSAKAAPENEGVAPSKVKVKKYSANSTSVTLKWKAASNAEGYRVYRLIDGKYKKAADFGKKDLSGKITGLEADTEYTFKVRAYNYNSDGSKVWGKSSKAFKAITGPVSSKEYKIKSIKVKLGSGYYYGEDSKVTLKWGKTKCMGYVIYIYNAYDEKWEKLAVIKDPDKTSMTFGMYNVLSGQKKALCETDSGYSRGYRFCVRPFNQDSAGNGTAYAKCFKAKEPYYDMAELESAFSDEYQLLSKMLPKAKADNAPNYYYTYITSADKKTGAITSTKTKSYVSEASRAAYEKFAKEHFKSGWTDAQKLLYTINWINKNNEYDYKYAANAGGYFANVTVQKLGQCNSYNGAIAEMLTILGYKGHYMQCMTPSVRSCQHFRTEIKIGKKTYSFESGETGWMWVFRDFDEVPLSKKAKK
ncbi:MAG: fibronectin type III domain-containing protein [Ruminococcus sp.]|nr:fibronectin type III domain-containing protein [Ruminococcus sp.]